MNAARLLRALTMVVLALFFLASVHTVSARPPKWEYLVVNAALKNRNLQQLLDTHGAQGWELVTFTRKDVAVFKRPAR